MANHDGHIFLQTPLVTLEEPHDEGGYFVPRHVVANDLGLSVTSPLGNRSYRTSISRTSGRRQSVITNVVVPSHLINAVSGSAQFSSVNNEAKRRQSCARTDPREQFDAQAVVRDQSTAVLKALVLDAVATRKISLARPVPDNFTGQDGDPLSSPQQAHLAVGQPSLPQFPPPPPDEAGREWQLRPSLADRRDVTNLRLPGLSQATLPTEPAPTRKKSMVTFAEPDFSPARPSVRKKSVASRIDDEKPKVDEKGAAEAVLNDQVEVVSAVVGTEKSAEDYFGHYTLDGGSKAASRKPSNAHGPSDLTEGLKDSGQVAIRELSHYDSSSTPSLRIRRTGLRNIPWLRSKSFWHNTLDTMTGGVHNAKTKIQSSSSMEGMYVHAIARKVALQRSKVIMVLFEWTIYLLLLAVVYFVFVGLPLWKGTSYWLWYSIKYKLEERGTGLIITGLALFYAFSPLLVFFEADAPMPDPTELCETTMRPGAEDTCLLIPCYKSEHILDPTLAAATAIFSPRHIFVIANGNSPIPLDDTEAVCAKYGVNHIWSPVGSKIVAQFVGCHAAKGFKNVLLIDDDCALPPNFPIVSDQLKENVLCMGYTIKSVGRNSSRGTMVQQAQDMEYKLSGLQRLLAGKLGSALFPHGAISLWDREFLIMTFHQHPGFNVSEDWFFGHVARELGCRTKMCTAVFIETETPDAIFFSSGGARGGFGEMTVFKQRFTRWNFFFVNGIYYNLKYIVCSWKLGRYEILTKILCFQEIYETLVYLATPLLLPVTFCVRPIFCIYLLLATFGLYFLNVIIFNEIHLRRKKERVSTLVVYLYYMPYKIILTVVNVISCYYALVKYATYFAKRHPKVIEDERAVGMVLQLEESADDDSILTPGSDMVKEPGARLPSTVSLAASVRSPDEQQRPRLGRRITVTAIGAQTQISTAEAQTLGAVLPVTSGPGLQMTVTTVGPRLSGSGPGSKSPTDSNARLSIAVTPVVSRRRSSAASLAFLTVGNRKFSVPNHVFNTTVSDSSRRPSVATSGLQPGQSPGVSLISAAQTFQTPRSGFHLDGSRRASAVNVDGSRRASLNVMEGVSPRPSVNVEDCDPHSLVPSSVDFKATTAEATANSPATWSFPRGTNSNAIAPAPSLKLPRSKAGSANAMAQQQHLQQQQQQQISTPRWDSTPGGRSQRLPSVAEVKDDITPTATTTTTTTAAASHDGPDSARNKTNHHHPQSANDSSNDEAEERRRGSSVVAAIGTTVGAWLRRASQAGGAGAGMGGDGRRRSSMHTGNGRWRGRKMSSTVAAGGGRQVLPVSNDLLEQLAEVQARLAQEKVEVVAWDVKGVAVAVGDGDGDGGGGAALPSDGQAGEH